MELTSLITADGILPCLRATSKKQALTKLAQKASEVTGIHERTILEVLLEREHLGSTGVGDGIAIPHGRLRHVDRIYGLFARLPEPIDFDSIDEKPVDLIFLLLAQETAGADHLKALACVSRLLRDRTVCEKLRGASTAEAIFAILAEPQPA